MKIYQNIEEFEAKKPVITIGTFDGVHQGHKEVIEQLKQLAQKDGGETVVFTFYPHPRLVVGVNGDSVELLSTIEEKQEQFEKLGIDHLVIFPFTKEFAQLEYADFVKQILVEKMNLHHLVVGYDHRMGRNRQGSYEALKELSQQFDFKISQLKALSVENTNISSTEIRKALKDGDIEKANLFLDYLYPLVGKVGHGLQIGRTIDFPTANVLVDHPNKTIPADGVYAVKVELDGDIYDGMLNIGCRPTIKKNNERTIEVNIFDFDGDIYNRAIKIFFVDRIRCEKRFESVQLLKDQLQEDKIRAQQILADKSE